MWRLELEKDHTKMKIRFIIYSPSWCPNLCDFLSSGLHKMIYFEATFIHILNVPMLCEINPDFGSNMIISSKHEQKKMYAFIHSFIDQYM